MIKSNADQSITMVNGSTITFKETDKKNKLVGTKLSNDMAELLNEQYELEENRLDYDDKGQI